MTVRKLVEEDIVMQVTLTPPDVERASTGETLPNDGEHVKVRLERSEERLQSCNAHAKEDKNVRNKEFVVARHDFIV